MNKSIAYFITALVAVIPFTEATAAEVEVKWSNTEKYSDIDAGEEHRKHFKDRTFKAFEQHFTKMAESLPAQQKLVLDITNLDLAGDVNHGGIKRIRVVKNIFFPRMEFSYQLLSADNSIVKSAEISLKDMGFLSHSNLRYRNKALGYEKEMFDDWFKKAFADELVK